MIENMKFNNFRRGSTSVFVFNLSFLCLLIDAINLLPSLPTFWQNSNVVKTMLGSDKITDGYVNLRAGNLKDNNEVIWHYSGLMRNPATGVPIVGIEGLEFVKRLPSTTIDIEEEINNKKKTNKGKNSNSNSTTINQLPLPSDYGLYLSKKVFVFTDLKNRSEAIKQFRTGKHGPLREVNPVKEIVELVKFGVLIDTTTTDVIVSKKDALVKKDEGIKQQNKQELINNIDKKGNSDKYCVEVKLPGGRILRNEKLTISRDTGHAYSFLDFVGNTKMLNELGVQYNIVNFMKGKTRNNAMNKWISFASPYDINNSGKSQEYYTIYLDRVESPNPIRMFNGILCGFAEITSNFFENSMNTLGFRIISDRFSNSYKNAANSFQYFKPDISTKDFNYADKDVVEVMGGIKSVNNKQDIAANIHSNDITSMTNNVNISATVSKAIISDELRNAIEFNEKRTIDRLAKLYPYWGLQRDDTPRRGTAVMKYTRYGEGPSWYSVGKPVTTEICAIRYNTLTDVPSYIRRLITQQHPAFYLDKLENLDDFKIHKDPLDKFKPWYSSFLAKKQ